MQVSSTGELVGPVGRGKLIKGALKTLSKKCTLGNALLNVALCALGLSEIKADSGSVGVLRKAD